MSLLEVLLLALGTLEGDPPALSVAVRPSVSIAVTITSG